MNPRQPHPLRDAPSSAASGVRGRRGARSLPPGAPSHIAFKVTGSPAVLSMAVRDLHQG